MSARNGFVTTRALAPVIVLLLALTGCGSAEASDDAGVAAGEAVSTPSTAGASPATPEPSATPGSCGWRHVNPGDPIPAELFAQCVVDATILAGTAEMSSTVNEITTAGPVTFRAPISGHFTSQPSGVEAIFIGEQGWLSWPNGRGWVASDPNGDPSERIAHSTVVLHAATADPEATRALLASAESWTPTVLATIDGHSVQGYSGTPVQEGVTYDEFTVWITDDDLPLRYEQSGMGYGGYPYSAQMDFTAYGEPVQITAP